MKTNVITVREITVNAFTNLKIDVYGPREYPIGNHWDQETGLLYRIDDRITKALKAVKASVYCGMSDKGQHKFISQVYQDEENQMVYKLVQIDAKDFAPVAAELLADQVKSETLDPFNGWSRTNFIEYLESNLIPDLEQSGRGATAEDFKTAIGFMLMA